MRQEVTRIWQIVLKEWKSLPNENYTNPKYEYVQYFLGLSACGGTSFEVKESSINNIFSRNRNLKLVITREAILRLNAKNKMLLKLNHFVSLIQWVHFFSLFFFRVKSHSLH